MTSIQKALYLIKPKPDVCTHPPNSNSPDRDLNVLRWGQIVLWSALFLFCFGSVALARTEDTTPPNPLELTTPDPLLPNPPVKRPLSPLERRRLSEELDALNNQAAAEFRAGNRPEAFEIWYREIRLRRVLDGPIEEVKTLGRVGEMAWGKNYKPEVQLITARLETIQQEATEAETLDQPLLRALGQAYQQVRVPGQALVVYEQILADARQQGDAQAKEETLKTMAQLHLAWFDYPKAAAAYEELLTIVQARGDRVTELTYLQELINIYNQAQKPENSLRIKKRLLERYLSQENYTQLPALKIAIASDYEALDQPDEASRNYQEAYNLALSLRQFAYASEALNKLAALYHSHDQPEYALQIYETLIAVDQQSYNFYGLMNSYDQMGQIYLQQNRYAQALETFQKGLELAQSLQYQETHFTRQIERVNQARSQ